MINKQFTVYIMDIINTQIESCLDTEYEIDCNGRKIRQKPRKVWFIYSRLPNKWIEIQLLGVFICPPNLPKVKKLASFRIRL